MAVIVAMTNASFAQYDRELIQSIYSEIKIQNDKEAVANSEAYQTYISSSAISAELSKLFTKVKSGGIKIYSIGSRPYELAEDLIGSEITSVEAIESKFYWRYSEPHLDQYGDEIYGELTGVRVDTSVVMPINIEDVGALGVIENWYLNKKTDKIEKEVVAYAPIMNELNYSGTIGSSSKMFFVKVENNDKPFKEYNVLTDIKVSTPRPYLDWFKQFESSSKAVLIKSVRELARQNPNNLWQKSISGKHAIATYESAFFFPSVQPLLDEDGVEMYSSITGERIDTTMLVRVSIAEISKIRSHETIKMNLANGFFKKSVTGIEIYKLKYTKTGFEGRNREDESKFIYKYN